MPKPSASACLTALKRGSSTFMEPRDTCGLKRIWEPIQPAIGARSSALFVVAYMASAEKLTSLPPRDKSTRSTGRLRFAGGHQRLATVWLPTDVLPAE